MATMMGAMQISNYVSVPIVILSQYFTKIKGTKKTVEKLENILTDNSYTKELEIDQKEKINIYPIAFNNYSLNISDINILNNITFEIEKGKKYVFIGDSGSGKSSILKSLMGYYNQSTEGNITYNGIKLKNTNINYIDREVSYIGQKPFILQDTVKNNLKLFEEISDKKVISVLNSIKGNRFIKNDVINDFLIKEQGSNLSGGEIQKISIARALIRDKGTLLCDEITSNLDKESSKEILDVLIKNKNITLIFISHQLSSEDLKKFDKVVFIKDKTIKEIGAYEELINKKGQFYEFWKR